MDKGTVKSIKGTPKNKLPNFVGWTFLPVLDD
jgi:hypothetical protein